jgi:Zn-dependent peptidase ImmA (M78 family)/transcriptional regulator with XRE-family HTH domain
MAKAVYVPITPGVLNWAIRESGYTADEVAAKARVTRDELRAWLRDEAKPTLTQARNLARTLKRTPSTFLLPRAPEPTPLTAHFRHAPGSYRSKPTFEERRYLREARRIQEVAKWLTRELVEPRPSVPRYTLDSDVEKVGQSVRQKLRPLLPTSATTWRTHAQAFHAWRKALEASGILVFVFPLGEGSARGFSLWDDDVPLVAVNSAWNYAARVFTLFHEYGHLLTRTSSVCVDRTGPKLSKPTDPAERWCEEFAATALLPWSGVVEILKKRFDWTPGENVQTLSAPRAIANAFKVSWRAATIRLIERDAATWGLYSAIPPYADRKKKGGGGGGDGRDRGDIRGDQYGRKTLDIFFRALDRQVLGRSDVLDYLDVPDVALDRLQGISRE